MPDEISGILNMVLPICSNMIQRGALKHERTVEEMKILYKQKSDSVYLFCENEIVSGAEKQSITTQVYSEYMKFCTFKRFRKLNDQAFARKMKERGYAKERKNVGGVSSYYWIGADLRKNLVSEGQNVLG